ncbi:MAG: MSMEG_1061 family FMN-dependent PPOX-type flavoprotein [Acidimicrobiales bacterium]
MPFAEAITDVDGLRRLYREPHELVLRKQIDHVDAAARAFIAAAPFVVLATASDDGTDASPRGGHPGFVAVLDDTRLAMGDLAGNNRLDSHTNLLAHPRVGMLFLVPGVDETLRVNGRATLTTDPAVLDAVAIDGRAPRLAIGIDVEECFVHCAKAFRRSRLWDPSSWPGPEEQPSAACALRDHLDLDVAPEVITADLEAGYTATMWEPGG